MIGMPPVIILPGICNSGPDHWQTLWEGRIPGATRFAPSNWFYPEVGDWVAAIDRAVTAAPEPPLLVAHSLGCLAVAHYVSAVARPVAGAFLVAVPDPAARAFPTEAESFADVPLRPFPFPSLMVASEDDPYAGAAYSRETAASWGADLVIAGAHGHINSSSGLGDWPAGFTLLEAFAARIAA